jgi:hypothetical protein
MISPELKLAIASFDWEGGSSWEFRDRTTGAEARSHQAWAVNRARIVEAARAHVTLHGLEEVLQAWEEFQPGKPCPLDLLQPIVHRKERVIYPNLRRTLRPADGRPAWEHLLSPGGNWTATVWHDDQPVSTCTGAREVVMAESAEAIEQYREKHAERIAERCSCGRCVDSMKESA